MMDKGAKTKKITRRIVFVFYVMFGLFSVLAARLFQVQVVQAGQFIRMARLEHTDKIPIPAVRGNIFDRHGELWATSMVGHSVAAFPSKVPNKSETAQALSEVLQMNSSEILKTLTHSPTFVWIARKIELDQALKVKKLKLPGIEVVDEPTGKRFFPRGKLACHVLGYTGVDDQGLDGVELYYDKELRGTPGFFMAETDGLGRVLPEGISKTVPAQPGKNITLTLDETIQYVVERELEKEVKKTHAKSGSVIVMDPESGEILALANTPDFDGSRYFQYPAQALRNHAISDDYEPGSTFKGILMAAALESGKISRNDKFLSGPAIQIDGWRIQNAEDGYVMSSTYQGLDAILINSLNVGAASVGLKVGTDFFSAMIDRFGFFRKTGIDLPGESNSIISNPKDWRKIQCATISFGQGIGVTPVQLVTAYAIIANGGHAVHPHVLKEMDSGKEESAGAKPDAPILSLQSDAVLKYLLSLAVEKGTGTQAAVPGYSTAGKTGTAQISEGGHYKGGAYIASFVGFVPVEKPVLAILVKVDEPSYPYWGGTVAAPIFREVAKEALWAMQIPPSDRATQLGSWKVWGQEEQLKPRKLN